MITWDEIAGRLEKLKRRHAEYCDGCAETEELDSLIAAMKEVEMLREFDGYLGTRDDGIDIGICLHDGESGKAACDDEYGGEGHNPVYLTITKRAT